MKNAVRQSQALGILTSEEWRLSAWRSAPNTVRIVSVEWRAWLKMRDRKRARDHPRNAERTDGTLGQDGRTPRQLEGGKKERPRCGVRTRGGELRSATTLRITDSFYKAKGRRTALWPEGKPMSDAQP